MRFSDGFASRQILINEQSSKYCCNKIMVNSDLEALPLIPSEKTIVVVIVSLKRY